MKVKEKQLQSLPDLDIQKQIFWKYTQPSKQQIEILTNYLINEQQLIQQQVFQQPALTIQDAYFKMTQYLKIHPHPAMLPIKNQYIQTYENQNEENSSGQPAFLAFQNYNLDVITLKILSYIWAQFPQIQTLKIFNCKLTYDEVKVLCNIVIQNKISKLHLEFTTYDDQSREYLIDSIIKSPHIQYLMLRGSQLSDKDAQLIQYAWEQNTAPSNLKALELNQNNIGRKGVQYLSTLLSKQNKLEYIGLARNNIQNYEDIRSLCDQLMKKRLNQEELQHYRELEALRDAQIKQQQIKLASKQRRKGDSEIPIIKLDLLVQNNDGSFSIVPNLQFKILNLSQNGFGESDKDYVEKFMTLCQDNFTLMLMMNNFENKTKEKLKKKFKNIIF